MPSWKFSQYGLPEVDKGCKIAVQELKFGKVRSNQSLLWWIRQSLVLGTAVTSDNRQTV